MTSDDVIAALDEHAVPLASTDPDAALDDLAVLADHLGEADVVGLGEATHGTRECFELKHRAIRLLVERLGFRTVAFEADVAHALAADRYVRRGDGSPEAALSDLAMWQWRTEAVRVLLTWLRAFNEGRPPGDRVRVRGVDLSDPSTPAASLRDYLRAVDPGCTAVAELDALADLDVPDDDAARRRRLDDAEATAGAVADRLERRREAYVAASSGPAWERARHLCTVVERNCEWHRVRHEHEGPHAAGMAVRDRLMAENVAWCHDRDPGEGVAVWAHNTHVQRGTFDDGQVWTGAAAMGEHIDRRLGDRYRPLGFDVGRGSFRAVPADDPEADRPRTFSVGDPIDGSATAHLDALETPCLVDLDAASADPALSAWFDRDRRIRWVGSVYSPAADPEVHYQRTDLPGSYDGLFVVGESTPTRPLDGG